MPNQYTKRAEAEAAMFPVNIGASDEEIEARDAKIRAEREARGLPKVEFGRDVKDKQMFDLSHEDYVKRKNLAKVDPMLGGDALTEAVRRYGHEGMAPKFLSDRCNSNLGLRGYQIVKDERGDVIRVGNLVMGEIPQEVADARREHYARESEDKVADVENAYGQEVAALRHKAKGLGIRVLEPGEDVTGDFSSSSDMVGETRSAGVHIRRQG